MPIGLGLACSHGTGVFLHSAAEYRAAYARFERDGASPPPPPQLSSETDAVLEGWPDRIDQAFATLRAKLEAYRPAVLVIIGGDQGEMFDSSNIPNLMIYTGADAWGYNVSAQAVIAKPGQARDYREEDLVRVKVDQVTAERLLNGLVRDEGYDVAFSRRQENLGRPGLGLPHAFHRSIPSIMPQLDIPVVLVYQNTIQPPGMTASRCYDLGAAIARILRNEPRRIAILGSGGLSHARWPADGWIDEKLDRWILDRLSVGEGHATGPLYQFDSHNMRGGTGEIRAWITTAGAMEEIGSRATIVDYIPGAHAAHGMAFAYWPEPSAATATANT